MPAARRGRPNRSISSKTAARRLSVKPTMPHGYARQPIVWEKFKVLRDGARIASKKLRGWLLDIKTSIVLCHDA